VDFDSIDACARRIEGRAIDALIGNGASTDTTDNPFGQTDYAAWARMMHVNTFAQLKIAEAFVENVAASDRKVMFFVSSRVGVAPPPGLVAYRSSKSALNQVVLQISLWLRDRGICAACGHPGFVQTDGTGGRGVFTAEESADRLFRLIDRITLADSGKFFEPDGSQLPIVTRQMNPNAVGAAPIPRK
jgi:NAD(P)-dependent dehydrogenase (short-subunit alcohol dehydrogenase family)